MSFAACQLLIRFACKPGQQLFVRPITLSAGQPHIINDILCLCLCTLLPIHTSYIRRLPVGVLRAFTKNQESSTSIVLYQVILLLLLLIKELLYSSPTSHIYIYIELRSITSPKIIIKLSNLPRQNFISTTAPTCAIIIQKCFFATFVYKLLSFGLVRNNLLKSLIIISGTEIKSSSIFIAVIDCHIALKKMVLQFLRFQFVSDSMRKCHNE
ncbi:hypothetical protein WUBG_07139 [Wuchereria bancrofti]|uniref:Uncharacterized protein n=1 Tax=Wuchereria bancrofti TaxID=6293 RepID=J9EHJ1_WUCBA|nr:hypothetical protein WUBG_07139 [Wuchereria bancrofti]